MLYLKNAFTNCTYQSENSHYRHGFSETIRLNRLVCQNVLVGHYKAEGEADTEDGITSRSLVVLPIDNLEICEIQVHVLQRATDEDYEQIFLVRNVSKKDLEVVDGTLYVDFLVDNGPKRVSAATKTKQNIGIREFIQVIIIQC